MESIAQSRRGFTLARQAACAKTFGHLHFRNRVRAYHQRERFQELRVILFLTVSCIVLH
jgi:hypothetical protein